MGYLSDQKGIYRRYLNERAGWNEHLVNSQNFIINNLPLGSRNSVAILGSGWLLDVPIDFLCANFRKVYLFDIFHPKIVSHLKDKFSNIIFVEQDISGGAIYECYQAVRKYVKQKEIIPLEKFNIRGFEYPESFDLIVSLNILNQLDIIAIDYLKKFKFYTDDEILFLRREIQKKHIDSLPLGKSILISDIEELQISGKNQIIEEKNLVHIPFPEGPLTKRWQWIFDSHYNYYPDRNVIFNVKATVI